MPIEVHVVPLDFFLLYIKFKLDCLVREPYMKLIRFKCRAIKFMMSFLRIHIQIVAYVNGVPEKDVRYFNSWGRISDKDWWPY